ncbi:MAG: Maf family protein [Candidatus Tyrphobacter sp.]
MAPIIGRKPLTGIVLASGSPRRAELLRSIGLSVIVVPSGYDEPGDPNASPETLAKRHARAKLFAVAARYPSEAVVAADTVVHIGSRLLGKPRDPVEATAMLKMLSGRVHRVHTAYALRLPDADTAIERLSTTTVRFCHLDPDAIEEYVATGEPTDKAGAYGIQGRAAALVESIDGDYFTVVGFPLGDFVRTLRSSGFVLSTAK